VALTAEVKISPAAGSFTLHKNLAKAAIFIAGGTERVNDFETGGVRV
jgi:hypothetical protein